MNEVFITGANRGIGLGLTRSFLKDGFNVIATTRSVDPSKAQDLLDLKAQHDAQLRIEVRELSYSIFSFLFIVFPLFPPSFPRVLLLVFSCDDETFDSTFIYPLLLTFLRREDIH